MRSLSSAVLAASLMLALDACSPPPSAPSEAPSQAAPVSGESDRSERVSAGSVGNAVRDGNVLTPQGFGPIEVGRAPPASIQADAAQVSAGCRTYSDKPRRIYAMTDGKVVARVTAMSGSSVKTAEGIAVGATEAAVRRAYPQAVETPHKYVEAPAKYLDWRPGGGTVGLRFEIDAQGKVSAIHAGREPEIEYVEGCA